MTKEERKEFRAVTVFTQEKFPIARELAQLEIENAQETKEQDEITNVTDSNTLSQQFLETLTEYHGDYN